MTVRETDRTAEEHLWSEYSRTRDPRTREAIVSKFERLAFSIANRYAKRGADFEDICQVALLALVKAVDRFDPATNYRFSSFAMPTIQGEIRRYFRDNCRAIHVPRGLQELSPRVQRAKQELTARHGRAATAEEIATALQLSERDVLEALAVEDCSRPLSLDDEIARSDSEGQSLEECLGRDDERLRQIETQVAVREAIGTLREPLRDIILMRYVNQMTQRAVAEKLGCTQIRISRMERSALIQLRSSFAVVN